MAEAQRQYQIALEYRRTAHNCATIYDLSALDNADDAFAQARRELDKAWLEWTATLSL